VHDSLGLICVVLLGGYKSPVSVFFRNGVGTARYSHSAAIGFGGYILTSHTEVGPGNLKASGAFGFGNGVADGFNDLGHINDDTTAQASAGVLAHAQDFDLGITLNLTYKA
jgi:hypothetical protein